jgi:hypothetical protein
MPIGLTLAVPKLSPVRLPPEVGALFAAGAGVLFINATAAEAGLARTDASNAVDPSQRSEIRSFIRHEKYHLMQTVCTGYCFARAQRIKETTLLHTSRSVSRDFRANWSSYLELAAYHLAPRFVRDQLIEVARVKIFRRMLADLNKNPPRDDHSLAGADIPELFKDLEVMEQEFKRIASSGLSAWHIVEGAASVAQITKETDAKSVAELDAAIIRGLARFNDGYGVAYRTARDRFGSRTAQLFLPAAALALRYERPGEAMLPLLVQLARSSRPGDEAYVARIIGVTLPELPNAGRRLGTAVSVWSRGRFRFWKRRHSFYQPQLDYLARGYNMVDEINALCDLDGFDDLPEELIHVIVRTTDQLGGVGAFEPGVARARLQLAAVQLRLDGRPRWERNTQELFREFAQGVIRDMIDGAMLPPTSGENGASPVKRSQPNDPE